MPGRQVHVVASAAGDGAQQMCHVGLRYIAQTCAPGDGGTGGGADAGAVCTAKETNCSSANPGSNIKGQCKKLQLSSEHDGSILNHAAGDGGAVGGTDAGAVRTPGGGLPGACEHAAARRHAGGRYGAALGAGRPGGAGRASGGWVVVLLMHSSGTRGTPAFQA